MPFNNTYLSRNNRKHLQTPAARRDDRGLGQHMHPVMRLAPDWHPATLQTALILGSAQAVTYIMKRASASFLRCRLLPP